MSLFPWQNRTETAELKELEYIHHAQELLSSSDDLIEHLQEKYPEGVPSAELSQWKYGVLTGRQEVIRYLKWLQETASKRV